MALYRFTYRSRDGSRELHVNTDRNGCITYAPSIVRRFIGRHIRKLEDALRTQYPNSLKMKKFTKEKGK